MVFLRASQFHNYIFHARLKVCPSHSSLWSVVEVLAIKIAIPWVMGLNHARAFTKRFIESSWSKEVTILQNWGKRWIVLHHCFVYCQTHLGLSMSLLLPVSPWRRCHGPCWKSKLIQPHILCKNSQYFNCASFAYIHVVHWLHCSLHSFLEKKKNLIIVIKKKKNMFYGALTELVLELE